MSELNFASNNPLLQKINGFFVTGEEQINGLFVTREELLNGVFVTGKELFNGVFLLNIKISKLHIFSKQVKEQIFGIKLEINRRISSLI